VNFDGDEMNKIVDCYKTFDDSADSRAALAFSRLYEEISSLRGSVSELLERHQSHSDNAPAFSFSTNSHQIGDKLTRRIRAPMPDPRLVRRIIRQRQLRGRFIDAEMFADPAWDMLLDLTAARAEHQRVSVTSLCIASGVPPTTALRWIGQMVEDGWLVRIEDDTDRRRAFVELSDRAADAMARYFAELSIRAASMT
jgi:hypothetical protein